MAADYLFIGTFLSSKKGSLSASETVAKNLPEKRIKLVSFKQNKIIRMLDILISILRFKGHVIHIEIYSGQAFIIAQLSAMLVNPKKHKLIFTLHGGMLAEFHKKNTTKVNSLLKKANMICTPSYFLQQYFNQQGFNVSYLPNSVNLSKFEYSRSEVKPFSILWVRAFNQIYNPSLAVHILKEVSQKHPTATLTMVGPDGGLLHETQVLIKSLNLTSRINMVGPIDNDALHWYYQTHQVLINTTSYESFGISLIEGASCGIPIVSTSVGEIPYLWQHKKNMLLVNSFNEKDFAMMITKIFDDAALEKQLSVNARQKAEQFTWDAIAPQWIQLLENQ